MKPHDNLTHALTAYVEAEEALTTHWALAATRTLTLEETQPLVKRADETRRAYADALKAAGYAVPYGLDR
ncbi:hypothetical protein [Streptomyces sp. NPDC057877]|uniref:hypothetical protein n=1 Tax=Streptomyces sp. NPDC057877 TaxID=3346269 RepID=UPI0036ACA939